MGGAGSHWMSREAIGQRRAGVPEGGGTEGQGGDRRPLAPGGQGIRVGFTVERNNEGAETMITYISYIIFEMASSRKRTLSTMGGTGSHRMSREVIGHRREGVPVSLGLRRAGVGREEQQKC